jgi:hypothetical protein
MPGMFPFACPWTYLIQITVHSLDWPCLCGCSQLLTAPALQPYCSAQLHTACSRSCPLFCRPAARCSVAQLLTVLVPRSCSLLSVAAQLLTALVAAQLLAATVLAAAHCSALCCPLLIFLLLIISTFYILCIRCLSESICLIHFTRGGEADMRPLSLVEVNQAILAWSLKFCNEYLQCIPVRTLF